MGVPNEVPVNINNLGVAEFIGLNEGVYTIEVQDDAGAIFNDSIIITLPQEIQVDVIIEDADHLHHSMSLNIKNYFPAVKSGGYFILEDFFDEDDKLRKYKDYNAKHGKRLMRDWSVTMEEVFENIKNKTFFEHPVFNKSDQEYLFQNVESVEIVYGDHPFSSLGILKKK